MKASQESIRNGRRANFYIVENLLIDHYLRIIGATAFAVYCCLVRHADDHHATFVGTAKLADESNLSQRQVRRILKRLEDYGLLRIVCTRKPVRKTVYWVLPVPPSGKAASTPLFDQCLPPEQGTPMSPAGDTGVRAADMGVRRNKEEQDPLNKTHTQDESVDLEEWVTKIAAAHPALAYLKGRPLSQVQTQAIAEAVARDGPELVLEGTRKLSDAVSRWPREDLRFIPNPVRFYQQSEYLKDAALWESRERKQEGPAGYVALPSDYVPASVTHKRELEERRENWNKHAEERVQ